LPFAVIPSGVCGARNLSRGFLRFSSVFSLFGVFFTMDDVMDGAFDEGGAFEQLGIRYFEDPYFAKSEIRKKATLKETTLDNALAALTKRHILIPKKRKQGRISTAKSFVRSLD
jgi:hypothetical protein